MGSGRQAEDDWTLNTLREYLLALRAADKTAVDAALASADRAVAKAETAAESRFEALNELRKVVTQIIGTLITRVEYAASVEALSKELANLSARLDRSEGQQGGQARQASSSLALAGFGLAAIEGVALLWKAFHG